MSQYSLHQQLHFLFSERNSEALRACLTHQDFQSFLTEHSLVIPVEKLVLAFTHSSFSHEYEVPHQELLEFFGDSVVQLIVTQELMKLYPNEKEGKLSKLRSSIVNEKTLAKVASFLELNRLLLVGKGEFKKELHLQETVLSDTMEALIGKIFNFHGLSLTSEKFLGWLRNAVPNAFNMENLEHYDVKSKLQEATLAKYKTLPRYTSDPAGEGFLVKLWVNEHLVAEGVYSSKKIGERELARRALENSQF
jgi:ribonuclease-3